MVNRDLIGEQRILAVDAYQCAVSDHTVEAAVTRAGGDHHHLLFRLGQGIGFTLHQGIVIGEEGTKFVWTMGESEKDAGHEAGLLLYRQDDAANILG